MEVFVAPLDVRLGHDTVLQPDVLVARRRDLAQRDLPAPPVLAVEVGSPSTWRVDRTLKRSRFEAAGCPAYWVVDPDAPSLTAWVLGDEGHYRLDAEVRGQDIYHAQRPFAVSLSPSELTRD
jgi:Uma2 family endonuclease